MKNMMSTSSKEEVIQRLRDFAPTLGEDDWLLGEGWDQNDLPEGGWYPAQRLSRQEAVRGFTLDAAYAAFMEDSIGSLEAGKKAEFIVLDRDIMLVPAAEIPQVRVLQTWLNGIRVYGSRY